MHIWYLWVSSRAKISADFNTNTKARLAVAKINILMIPNTFGKIFPGLTRQKLKFWKV